MGILSKLVLEGSASAPHLYVGASSTRLEPHRICSRPRVPCQGTATAVGAAARAKVHKTVAAMAAAAAAAA